MPTSDRTSIRQRIIDITAALILTVTGIGMLIVWIAHPGHHPFGHALYGAWVILLTAASLAAAVGAGLRTTVPGRRLSAGFALELAGWGMTGFLIFWYTVFDYRDAGDWKLAGALLTLTTLLVGNFLRLWSAMRQAKRAGL